MIVDRIDHIFDRLGLTIPSHKINSILKNYKLIQPVIFPGVIDTRGIIYDINSHGLVDVSNTYLRINTSDLRKDDVVFDIGSHIGEFGLFAANTSKWVYAFEPITPEDVSRNSKLNKCNNITVIPCGIGDECELDIKYFSEERRVSLKPLSGFVEMYGCDFLNSNCEGGEWTFQIDTLKHIRRLEIEFHTFFRNVKPRLELIDEIKEYFDVDIKKNKWVLELHGWNYNV